MLVGWLSWDLTLTRVAFHPAHNSTRDHHNTRDSVGLRPGRHSGDVLASGNMRPPPTLTQTVIEEHVLLPCVSFFGNWASLSVRIPKVSDGIAGPFVQLLTVMLSVKFAQCQPGPIKLI